MSSHTTKKVYVFTWPYFFGLIKRGTLLLDLSSQGHMIGASASLPPSPSSLYSSSLSHSVFLYMCVVFKSLKEKKVLITQHSISYNQINTYPYFLCLNPFPSLHNYAQTYYRNRPHNTELKRQKAQFLTHHFPTHCKFPFSFHTEM